MFRLVSCNKKEVVDSDRYELFCEELDRIANFSILNLGSGQWIIDTSLDNIHIYERLMPYQNLFKSMFIGKALREKWAAAGVDKAHYSRLLNANIRYDPRAMLLRKYDKPIADSESNHNARESDR